MHSTHPDFLTSVSSKIHECTKCTFKTVRASHKRLVIDHMKVHQDSKNVYRYTFVCYHCQYAARSKRHLIDHMQMHRDSKSVYICYKCDFRTHSRILFTTHTRTHSSESTQFEAIYIKEENVDINVRNPRSKTCTHCNATFKKKTVLNDHILRKHPEFVASITGNIHECKICSFKATITTNLKSHLLKHPETAGGLKKFTDCEYFCRRKRQLIDHMKVHNNSKSIYNSHR
nr:unnamed protein product [Callosobruchus analis]